MNERTRILSQLRNMLTTIFADDVCTENELTTVSEWFDNNAVYLTGDLQQLYNALNEILEDGEIQLQEAERLIELIDVLNI